MRITSKGQVTIPQHLREQYGLMPETEVQFVERDGFIGIEPATGSRADRGDLLIAALRSGGTGKLTTDEIMQITRGWNEDQ